MQSLNQHIYLVILKCHGGVYSGLGKKHMQVGSQGQ